MRLKYFVEANFETRSKSALSQMWGRKWGDANYEARPAQSFPIDNNFSYLFKPENAFFIGILKRMIYYIISFFLQFSCCGVDNGRDFEFSRFNRDFTLHIFNQTLSISNLQTPLACCNSASRRTTFEPGACAKYPIRKDHTHYFEVRTPNIWQSF